MKSAKILGAAAAFSSVTTWAHPGHEHHALQSNLHFVADGLLAVGAVVAVIMFARAWVQRNEG